MATTTPNFGWPVPTSTDLVKDGATAIEALGDGVDASLVDLKGGTTGQVLAKTSGTDLDFTWVTTDDTNAIQNAIVDAKGDLIAASAADTPARLAVGNNGESLVADSSTSTGLRWQGSIAAGKNNIINGGMDIWQRGTSFTVASSTQTYTTDRWMAYRTATGATVSRQTTSPNYSPYYTRVQRDSGNTGTNIIYLTQAIETLNSRPLAGETITLSWWARAGANYSAASSNLTWELAYGTGTDQNMISGFTGQTNITASTKTLTTSWQQFTTTGTVSTSATQVGVIFYFTPVGTAGAADYFDIADVQIEVGSVATSFSRAGATIQGELAACQRYYRKSYQQGTAPATAGIGAGLIVAATSASVANNDNYNSVNFNNPMRTAPTVTIYPYATPTNTARVSNGGGTDLAAGSGTVITTGDSGFYLKNGSGGAISSSAGVIVFHYQADAEL